jgi:8-amino-7-oxononanoate synthase
MPNFTSALYLGLRHPSAALRPWSRLTTGVPAALATPPSQVTAAQEVAKLQGCEQATLSPSTLHLFWDLFGLWASEPVAIYLDSGAYPIARWGVERSKSLGVHVRSFPHHNSEALRQSIKKDALRRLRPLVVADGFCPGCGRPVPVASYLESVREFGGWMVLDDTQAMGILGQNPDSEAPYGRGGGGSLQWNNVSGPDILVISSLAKGFGVPVAVLSGSCPAVRWFEEKSETRVHCSPPSFAATRAIEHALMVNEKDGDDIRLRLAGRVRYFRSRLKEIGLSIAGGLFPVQTLVPLPWLDAATLHDRLLGLGVRSVLHRARNGIGSRLSFLITALHSTRDIDYAVDALAFAVHNAKVRIQSPEDPYEMQTQ